MVGSINKNTNTICIILKQCYLTVTKGDKMISRTRRDRGSRVSHHVNLNMVGLYEIRKTMLFGNDITQDHFMGIFDGIETCLEYCYNPTKGCYCQTNQTILDNTNEFVVGYKLKYLHANTVYYEAICEFKTMDELSELFNKYCYFDEWEM